MAQPSPLPWWHAQHLDVPPWKPENVCMQGTVYWAAEGQGAYVQRPGSEAQRLQAAEVDLSASGLVVVGSASHLTAETQARQRAWLGCATGWTCMQMAAMTATHCLFSFPTFPLPTCCAACLPGWRGGGTNACYLIHCRSLWRS